MSLTLYDGLVSLRNRINDSSDTGQWLLAAKKQALNVALRRTLFRTRSYCLSQSLTLVASTHTYDISPIFEPKSVRIGDNTLSILPPGSLAIVKENWEEIPPAAITTHFISLGGGRLRLFPTPNTQTASMLGDVLNIPTAGGTGYAVGDILSIATSDANKAKVGVTTIGAGGAVAQQERHNYVNSEGNRVYYRGYGYTIGAGKATTADTGVGTGCTVEITRLCKLDVYGPATPSDLGSGRIATVASAPTAGGTGYTVNDILYITTGGTKGTARVTAAAGGIVSAVELVSAGVDYTTGTGKATAGGTGTGCTVNITAISDGTYLPITELVEAGEEAWLLAAEEVLRASRPNMPGSLAAAQRCHELWEAECEKIRVGLGLP